MIKLKIKTPKRIWTKQNFDRLDKKDRRLIVRCRLGFWNNIPILQNNFKLWQDDKSVSKKTKNKREI